MSVITPTSNGQAVSINNPLFSTTFHPLNPVDGDFTNLGGTPVSIVAPLLSPSLTYVSEV